MRSFVKRFFVLLWIAATCLSIGLAINILYFDKHALDADFYFSETSPATVAPSSVVDAYAQGKMDESERSDFEMDLRLKRIQPPKWREVHIRKKYEIREKDWAVVIFTPISLFTLIAALQYLVLGSAKLSVLRGAGSKTPSGA